MTDPLKIALVFGSLFAGSWITFLALLASGTQLQQAARITVHSFLVVMAAFIIIWFTWIA